jgi:hypothetical protein
VVLRVWTYSCGLGRAWCGIMGAAYDPILRFGFHRIGTPKEAVPSLWNRYGIPSQQQQFPPVLE